MELTDNIIIAARVGRQMSEMHTRAKACDESFTKMCACLYEGFLSDEEAGILFKAQGIINQIYGRTTQYHIEQTIKTL